MKAARIIVSLLSFLYVSIVSSQEYYTPTRSDTWVVQDALNRKIDNKEYSNRRKNKTVGLFYFIWQGAHGYDQHSGGLPNQGVMPAAPYDTVSPYDISEMLRENPDNPQYGPVHAFHYWGQPYMGYYLANDEWIIRKHAQMISDAGIDVIILDVTNGPIYMPQVKKICEVYTRMRKEGNATPQIAFIISSNPEPTFQNLYNSFYKQGLYRELWFEWKGKPLVLCQPEAITEDIRDQFTVRRTWFASSWDWFGDGKDKWTWADLYPQQPGWHENPDIPEEISVCAATHPTSNIGRSFHNGKQPEPKDFRSGEGLYFAEQFDRALEVDPEFVFVTGWNEWVAMRFTNGAAGEMLGKKIKEGDTYFVDQYNEEYSRDIEPMKGGFGDNYYYQMVDYVRKYKGVNESPVYSKEPSIKIDGKMDKWNKVKSFYLDDKGDIADRNHPGWGRIRNYSNNTGRNDIIESRVSCDGKNLYFYVKTNDILSPYTDKNWMRLFIQIEGFNMDNWEGFQYVVNNKVKNSTDTYLQHSSGGWNWQDVGTIKYQIKGNEMELAISLSDLEIKDKNKFIINFKWIDNAVDDGDIIECIDNGDAAPNGRFRYQFSYNSAK
ncbi:MAG: hypothetical protein LBV43_15720 [Prevotella sp.]|jgi:hypothetical protein|nr:hypothetical protein [Prevotella sp.]